MKHMNEMFSKQFINLSYDYPKEIRKYLFELFTEIVKSVDKEKLISILFVGSGARNELSYKIVNKNIDIFSDFEFVIIVDKMLSKEEFEILNTTFRNFEKKWNIRSPLFYIDYGVSTLKKFKITPPTLWAYEAKNFGVVVYGRDVRKDIVNVTINNLDYGTLNELIIVRLWNMLVHVNEGFIKRENNDYEDFIIKFYYSRNILDILTILLPNYNVLIGGYKERTNYFINNFNNKQWESYKTSFKKITDLKVDLIDNVSLEESQSIFFEGYINLIADITKINNNGLKSLEKNIDLIIRKNIFKEKPIRLLRRKFIELQLFKKYYNYNLQSLKLFFNDKIRINLLFLLLNMHKSLDLNIKKDDKVYYLKNAIKYFNIISYNKKYTYDETMSFEDNFIKLRESVLDFMMIWFYGRSNVKKEDIKKFMKWREK